MLLLVLGISSCRGLGTSPIPPTITFTATPTIINPGQSATLSWSTTNATTVTIDNGIGTVAATGTTTVSPTQATTYTLTASNNTKSATAQVTIALQPTVTINANPSSVGIGQPSTLTVVATNATQVTITNNANSTSVTLANTGGTTIVNPTVTTIYTATASAAGATSATAQTTVTVTHPLDETAIKHVIFMLQENRTFDHYFGMLNPYRQANATNGQAWNVGDDGKDYNVDGIDDKLTTIFNVDDEYQQSQAASDKFYLFKLTSSCIDDETSDWLASYGDVNRYNFLTTRPINMDGFVHTAEGYAKACAANPNICSGAETDLLGQRAMGYYDQGFLNYYYFMASNFALSDRWFSPVASKSTPNRIATYTGGTTEGLVFDPFRDDAVNNNGTTVQFPTFPTTTPLIFQELDQNNVTWKIYYSLTQDSCTTNNDACSPAKPNKFPVTTFSDFAYSANYLYTNPTHAACTGTTKPSGTAVNDPQNAFCIDTNKVAPLSQYFTDLQNGTLPSFAFIEAGFGSNDEHPGSGQSILNGQAAVASIVNALMTSSSWPTSAFFLSYDEGGGPYDHVPPVPMHTNDNTDANLGITTDISSIAVNPDQYAPCLLPMNETAPDPHCDLRSNDPGANPADAPAVQGFSAQLGFRTPNIVISPYARRHYVNHIPMDHTAVIKFVENRFIGPNAHLTARDAAQPNLLDFFDFVNEPWGIPPTPPTPNATSVCTPTSIGP